LRKNISFTSLSVVSIEAAPVWWTVVVLGEANSCLRQGGNRGGEHSVRQLVIFLATALSCASCGMVGPPPAELTRIDIRTALDDPNCRAYSAWAQVDLSTFTLVGRACPTPDGGWQVTEGTSENPRRYQQYVSAAAASAYPWRSGPPIGISTGRMVIYYPFDQPRQDHDIIRFR
jgi:hypothetical protein